ncbi:cytochrome oxidase assembly protein ShyY1 [Mumia flava]|uniref:SURF1-like protein n=1 Tax=Mumia flava TaxID=1348852 RepID=A0A2M9BI59_9ACTN|nr:SURF1 family protein [Mumia flava]PJJ57620.1 cytochrome oxidase assembly protein ShyY1 [Mumia flava]
MTAPHDDQPSGPRVGWFSRRLWGLHALVVVAVVFCLFMGLWQMGVYDTRREHERADQQAVPEVALTEVLGPDDAFTATANHRPVELTGTYAPAGDQVWVSGRDQDGTDGYWLVAPVLVDGVEAGAAGRPPALLVVRGWSAEAGDVPEPAAGQVTISAVLQAGDARGSGLDPDSRVIDGVRIPALVNDLPYDLYGGYGIVTDQTPPESADLAPVAPPDPEVSWSAGLRNLAYAIQWWIFGAFAVFMWWRMCTDLRNGPGGDRPSGARPAPKPLATAE